MNLTHLKSAAELAKTSQLNRDEWGEDIDPDDVLRLVEVARLASVAFSRWNDVRPPSVVETAIRRLGEALEGIEP